VLDPDGRPIPRLYSAGELGSIYGFLYQGGGNLAECLAFGRIAGANAAAEPAHPATRRPWPANLDADARTVLEEIDAAETVPLHSLSAAEARAAAVLRLEPGPELERVEDRTIAGPDGPIPIRVYADSDDSQLPVLVWLHGGGWVFGGLDQDDSPCRRLARESGCAVVSVDYRLAPEAPFPIPLEDCYAATAFVAGHGAEIGVDGTRIAVGGDSVGGNLAAAVCLLARERGGPPISFQLLVCPALDFAFDTGSYTQCANDFRPKRDLMRWFWGHYLASAEDGADPLASPLRADELSGLPPALVITAEYDPLRDEGEAYAARLAEAGVEARASRYDGTIHFLFLMADRIAKGRAATTEACDALRRALTR
jgi:acetyl esterase